MNSLEFLQLKQTNYAKYGSVVRPDGSIMGRRMLIGDIMEGF